MLMNVNRNHSDGQVPLSPGPSGCKKKNTDVVRCGYQLISMSAQLLRTQNYSYILSIHANRKEKGVSTPLNTVYVFTRYRPWRKWEAALKIYILPQVHIP